MLVKRYDIDINNRAAVAEALQQVAPQSIACCNWAETYPYAPQVQFRLFHTGSHLVVGFEVAEEVTMARVSQDNGRSWTDSCVEMFLSVGEVGYYNIEATCIGHVLMEYHKTRHEVERASEEVLASIVRYASLPKECFEERRGNNRWTLTLAIPATAYFKEDFASWAGRSIKGNFYKCGDDLSQPHFLSWSPIATPKPNFHCPEFFAEIEFEK